MKIRPILHLILPGLLLVALAACKKVPEEEVPQPNNNNNNTSEEPGGPNPTNPTTVLLRFSNYVNTHDVDQDGSTYYTNSIPQAFNVLKIKYYISNVVLLNENGSTYAASGIYKLIDEADINNTGYILVTGVPPGNYTGVRFMVGVDSAAANGPQTGDLDPAKGMFWSAANGYIAYLIEGQTKVAGVPTYSFHIGGYAAGQSALRNITVNFTSAVNGGMLVVDGSNKPLKPHIIANVPELFQTPNAINFTVLNNINAPGANAQMIADNYMDMFYLVHFDQ